MTIRYTLAAFVRGVPIPRKKSVSRKKCVKEMLQTLAYDLERQQQTKQQALKHQSNPIGEKGNHMDEKFKKETEDEFLNHPKTEEAPAEEIPDGESANEEADGEEDEILRKERRARSLAYICAPYRPVSDDPEKAKEELKENIRRQAVACRTASAFGRIPIAPALYFTRFLRDSVEQERNEGLELGLECIKYCKDLIVVGNRISEGMRAEIMEASRCGVNIIIWRYADEPLDNLLRAVFENGEGKQRNTDGPDAEDTEKPADGSAEKIKEDKDHE